MKRIVFLAIIMVGISCSKEHSVEKKNPDESLKPQTSIELLLKNEVSIDMNNLSPNTGYYRIHKFNENKDGVIKSFKIDDKIDIPNTNLTMVFVSYSVGSDIVRIIKYVIKDNGKYYITNKYYSSYDDDPFKNGMPEESKKILEKAEKWEKSNESIDWW